MRLSFTSFIPCLLLYHCRESFLPLYCRFIHAYIYCLSRYVSRCPIPSSVVSTCHPQSATGVQILVIAHHVIDSVHTSDRHALTSYAASRLPTPPVRPPTVLHRPLPGSIFRSGRTRPVRYHPKACCERCVGHHPFVSFHFTPLFGVVEAYSITQVLLDLSP